MVIPLLQRGERYRYVNDLLLLGNRALLVCWWCRGVKEVPLSGASILHFARLERPPKALAPLNFTLPSIALPHYIIPTIDTSYRPEAFKVERND